MLLDPETLALAPGVERLLPREGLKTELFSCLVETNTPICETAFEAGDELRRLRRLVVELAEREGLAVAAAGSHPFSIPEEQRIVRGAALPEDGRRARGDREGPARLRPPRPRRDGELRGVPPHARGAPALAAGRARGLGELAVPRRRGDGRALVAARQAAAACRGAAPRRGWRTVADWEAEVSAAGVDYTRIWWDARPHPRLGTLEVRIADQATSVDRAAALVALVQALCAAPPQPEADLARRRRAGGARARHVGARRDAARARRGASAARDRPPRAGSRRLRPIS